MPFEAFCPYCSAKLTLSRKRLGASVPCAQCGSHFTAAPPDEVAPGPSVFRQLAARSPAAMPSEADESPAESPASAETVPAARPGSLLLPSRSPGAIPDWINLWGFAGLLLAAAALFLATTGWLRGLAMPLAVSGLLACVAGAVLTPRKKFRDSAWLGTTALLALAELLVVCFWPHYLNRFWGMERAVPAVDPAMQFLASRNNQVPRGRAVDSQTWVEADRHAIRQGDIHVRVEEVRVELDPGAETPTPKYLSIIVRVSNVGQLQRYSYRSPVPALRDSRGKAYVLRHAGAGIRASIKPLGKVEDQWFCEMKDAGIDFLQLEFPASAWGGKGTCRFRIPRPMIVLQTKE